MKPLAIVTPWFGKNLKGGAEQQAWQLATRLAARGHTVEVLTTCCRSFQDDWAVNHLKAGVSQEYGVKIRRFKVDSRNYQAFDSVNQLMLSLPFSALKLGLNPVTSEKAETFCSENINSTELLNYLKNQHNQYQAFVFLPYLYGCILKGLPIVAKRAFLQPCLHDEVYAYLPEVAEIFHSAKGLLFISEGEAQLARKLYGPGIIPKSLMAGAGVEAGQNYDPTVIKVVNIAVKKERFVLCLGRRDAGKNTDLLVRAYINFKQTYPESNLKLILAGPGNTSFNNASFPDLIDLGLVEDSEKETLLANCLVLLQPSQNESYSRVIMEAWFYGRPVVAHRDCLATAMAVEEAQGGWLAQTASEWTELIAKIDQIGEEQLAKYGAKGQVYAKENAVWEKVIERYETALGLPVETVSSVVPKRLKLEEIHQLLPNLAYGDAISNHAISIRDYLRSCGYKSEIFVKCVAPQVAHEAIVFKPNCINEQAGLIYHHSIGSEITEYAITHPGSKCLIYHNITPAEFFLPYRPEFAKLLETGRIELKQLAQHFPISVGDSAYNAAELLESGFQKPGVLPIIIDPQKWDMIADASLMQQLQDGKTNLLFVGRIAPNKRQEHLIESFAHYLTMDREARLILAGWGDINDPYYRQIINTIERLNLTNYVLVSGQVNDAQLLAFYRTAHLFWSMSEHEGFGVPLVEAMWFDVPVLAYSSSAVPETLSDAGLMFNNKHDLVQVAALAKILAKDNFLRAKIIKVQRRRREIFTPDNVDKSLSNLLSKMKVISR